MLSEQLDREFTSSDYDGLKKVYSIWICMNVPHHIGNAMAEYRMIKQDRVGKIPEVKSSYDKLSVVIICLNGKWMDTEAGTLHGFLNTLLSPELGADEKEKLLASKYGMQMEEEIGEELRRMCNLSEAIEERGIEKGIFLTKRILGLFQKGWQVEQIAEECGISTDKVHEIIEN